MQMMLTDMILALITWTHKKPTIETILDWDNTAAVAKFGTINKVYMSNRLTLVVNQKTRVPAQIQTPLQTIMSR